MKQIQFIGSRVKSDFLIYLAHVIANSSERVLIVDTSADQEYKYAYSQLKNEDRIVDFQNVEFISGITSKDSLIQALSEVNESIKNYQYIFIDIKDKENIGNWCSIDNNYYVSDDERFNIMRDVDLLNELLDTTQKETIRRIHFESIYQVDEGYMEFLLENRVQFVEIAEPVEFDINHIQVRQHMQHEHEIPYKRLNKQYKKIIEEVVTEICDVSKHDLKHSNKQSFGSKISGLFKKQQLQPNKEGNTHELKGVE